MKTGGPLAGTVGTLISQRPRGREATEYILAVTRKVIGAASSEPLARSLDSFARRPTSARTRACYLERLAEVLRHG